MPFRKGSSSSVQRWTALSSFSTHSAAEAMRSAISSRSRCSFGVAGARWLYHFSALYTCRG